MTDKFPEALDRFTDDVSIKNIQNWEQLKLAFGHWAGRKWLPTHRQLDGLAIEARKLGLETRHLTREQEIQRIFWKATMQEKAQQQKMQREKDFSTKYNTFSGWIQKETRTTRYQQRVINYIRNHPNATLAEARGHKRKRYL